MGKYSDSDDDKKKRKKKKKKRSRSRSYDSVDSKQSSKQKKSKKHKKRSRSRSPDYYRRSRSPEYRNRSRSRSPKYYRRRSRSRSHSRGRSRSRGLRSRSRSYSRYSRSRSRSFGRYSRSTSRGRYSRSRSPGYERYSSRRKSRSLSRGRRRRSRSRDKYSRSRSRSFERYKSKSSKRRSRSVDRVKSSSRYSSGNNSPARKIKEEKDDLSAKIPGFDEMTPSEQAKLRMQMALKAAAAADEKIKQQTLGEKFPGSNSVEDQLKFTDAVRDIESSSFEPSAFKSSRSDKTANSNEDKSLNIFNFGTAAEFKPETVPRKTLIIDDSCNLAHPSLFVDPEEKMDRWIQRLAALRKKKLEGEAL